MAAVSREFLATLRALPYRQYDRSAIETGLLTRLTDGLPGWTGARAEPLFLSLALLSEAMFQHGEMEADAFHMGQMVNSQGQYLDVYGVERNLPRLPGEGDDDYLFRLANAGETRGLGSLPTARREAFAFNSDIVDVQAVTRINRQDVDVYALKASHAALDATESAALLAHLNLQRNKMAGVDVRLPAVTNTAFTIDVTLQHQVEISGDIVARDARTAIYAWLADHQRIGAGVFRSAINDAAFVADVENVTIAEPSADLPATNGVVYTCASNATDVIIRTVVI